MGSGLPYLPEKPARDLSDEIREAFADKHSLPQKGILHSLGDSADSSGMARVRTYLL